MRNGKSIYREHLDPCEANYVPLSPLGFLERAAQVYPDHTALIHGKTRRNWREEYARCRQLASALAMQGIGREDTVSIMAHNCPAHFEVYFGVPMAGAVISAINTRLDAQMIAFLLEHSETKLFFVDRQFHRVVREALALMKKKPIVIDINDSMCAEPTEAVGAEEYEAFIARGDPNFAWQWPEDEWAPIALNYTSGTTGDPKGVVYHHRGAYLNAIGNALVWNMQSHPVYLWTLPMFHASGWCFHWTITAMAGTHICLRKVDARDIFALIEEHGVTHFTAAPVVLNFLIHAPAEVKKKYAHIIEVMTAGSAPPAPVIAAMEEMGFNITHVYGATEVFGPNMSCAWHPQWNELPLNDRAHLKARQGVRSPVLEYMIVANHETLEETPWDGKTIGECMMRGNVVMSGYLKNPKTTQATFKGGWYHTGDLAVRHPNGYIEVKDRLKDIIISGGENIPTLEVESVLYKHPAVLETAVVAKPDERWGEIPCAFIELKAGAAATEAEIIDYCRANMAHYKAPKRVVFGPLDKTPTGKIQKFVLRERAKVL
jgi:fatty-acyl-CoA synthase